jgi:hypothetical protein
MKASRASRGAKNAAPKAAAKGPAGLPPGAQLMQMMMGFMVAKSVSTAARLGVPDALAAGPRSHTALAEAVGANPGALHRLMRALASVGVFAETAPGTYALTPLSETLRSDVPGSLRAMAVMVTTPSHWLPWGRLDDTIRRGVSVADDVIGQPLWDYYRDNPEEAAWFNGAMTSFSGLTAGAAVKAYDFSPFKKIVDVGGGHGFLLETVLRSARKSRGTVYDLPQTVNTANAPPADLADRMEFSGGDFFKSVPAGADCYLLKHIIHDWADEQCRQILGNIRSAMASNGKVLILDAVLPEITAPDQGFLMDMNMLAMTPGGLERTAQQFRDLCRASGLKLTRIVPTPSPVSIVEAVKA